MAKTTTTSVAPAPAAEVTGAGALVSRRPRRRYSLLNRQDKLILALMVGVPLALDLLLIWGPTLASIGLSFTDWSGFGAITAENWIGFKNYQNLFTSYIFFRPALEHNLIWLAFLTFISTPFGMFLAVLLDREMRGTRIYQSIFFLPVVLALVVVGFIWELQYAPTEGFINNFLGLTKNHRIIDWLGNPRINLLAALVAASWRHVGYIMVLYLAGLKSVDPSLREAAAIDGANQRQAFLHVVFPVMAPINVIIVVVTIIESLRAFDIAYIINRGKNGLELLSILITNNSISEASLVGFGSAIAVVLLVISLGPIVLYLSRVMRDMAP
ncbi:MAG TPA: sugar ABC transporter permease [Candidatus Dormibacteraeota bacterium]|nr:sugar ABC transporter permease [Candidatus Dormibacteraeota bacterium]